MQSQRQICRVYYNIPHRSGAIELLATSQCIQQKLAYTVIIKYT